MSKIWSMMDIGKRTMMNSQTALQTTAHNVANKSTKGYSRQRVDIVSNAPTGTGQLRIGTGARAARVTRINNPYIEKQLEKEGNSLGHREARSSTLARVEQIYNEQANKGLNKYLGEFFNAFRELSNNPESLAGRALVKESANFLAKDFHRVHQQLGEVQKDVDFQITTLVEDVNQMTREISHLNEKIQSVEIQSIAANDERDRRDHLIKELSKKVNIKWAEGDSGQVTITAGNSAVLVSGFSQIDLEVSATPGRDQKREGNVDVFYRMSKEGTPINMTGEFTGGTLGGLLDIRDRVINESFDNMDEIAYTLATKVNQAHVIGYDRHNKRGEAFFHMGNGAKKDAALSISVNTNILKDVSKIAIAGQANAPADNRIAHIISSIQYTKNIDDNSYTLDDFYGSVVGKIGIEASRANSATQSQMDSIKQLTNIRESISGVSLDEETTKMIEYQKSFDASARLIRTADEMVETVLNLKRL